MKSKPYSLNQTDWKKIAQDSAYFFIVPLIFYLTAFLGTIQQPNHIFSLKDFYISNTTIIVIFAWLGNQILNILKKFIA